MERAYPRQTYVSSLNGTTSSLGNDELLYDPMTGSVHRLNKTARFIRDYCKQPRSVVEITVALQAQYPGVDSRAIRADVEEAVASFCDKGLLNRQWA
jgi:hypothetical protein